MARGAQDDVEREPEDHEGGEDHEDHALLLALRDLELLGGDDLLPLPRWDHPDLRLVRVVDVRIGQDVLELLLRQEVDHRASEHALARARLPDQEHVPLLGRGLLRDLDRVVLADDLVEEPRRHLYLGRRFEWEALRPRVELGRWIYGRPLRRRLVGRGTRNCLTVADEAFEGFRQQIKGGAL